MGHKVRMKQTEKINREEEEYYFEYLREVLSTVEAYKRQVDEVEKFEDEWIKINPVTLPKFTSKNVFFRNYQNEKFSSM